MSTCSKKPDGNLRFQMNIKGELYCVEKFHSYMKLHSGVITSTGSGTCLP